MSNQGGPAAAAGQAADDSVPVFHDYTLRSDFER